MVTGRVAAVSPAPMANRITPSTAERRLRMALAEEQFRLYYQPVVSLQTQRMVKVEALIRWEAPGPTPDTRLYGVEFLELDAPLRQYLGRPVDERRGHMPQYQFTSPIARASKFT